MKSSDALWSHQEIALVVVVIVVATLVVLFFWRGGRDGDALIESPEAALKRRYANGELDDKTYEHMLQELRK